MILSRRALLAMSVLRLKQPVRVGIWGSVGHTDEVLKALPLLPDAKLVAFAEPDAARAARLSKSPAWSGAKAYTDPRKMLDEEKLDVVAIANDNGARAAAILECAGRRIHPFAEKPVALTEADLAAVKKAVQQNRVRLGCMLNMRSEPHYLAMKAIVKAGTIGDVAQIESQKSYKVDNWPEWRSKYSTYGGTIPWIGVHMIDLMRATTGREFRSVVSMQSHMGFPELGEMENTTGSLFRLDNGGVALMHLDYFRTSEAPTHGDDRMRIAGTKGIVEYQMSTGVTLQERGKPPRTVTDFPPRTWLFADFLSAVYGDGRDEIKEDDIYGSTLATIRAWESAKSGKLLPIEA